MSSPDDDWCDWCGEKIRARYRRRADDRVFCGAECLVAYRVGSGVPATVELPAGLERHDAPAWTESVVEPEQPEVEGPPE